MRTVVRSYSGSWGGAEQVALSWAEGLDGEVWLACPPGPLADAIGRSASVRWAPFEARRLELRGSLRERLLALGRVLGHRREARSLTAALAPDVVIANGMRSMLALSA